MKRKELKAEISGLSREELLEKERSISEELMKLRFRAKTGRLEQSHLFKELRKQKARAKTALGAMK